jgi:hypothetical protein
LGAVLFAPVLCETGLAATFEAEAFEPVAFAAVFAVLFGIELLLFLEGLAADALAVFRESFTEALAWPLVAPRLMPAAAFLEAFEVLFVRDFCDTACARELPRPCSVFSREPIGAIKRADGFG